MSCRESEEEIIYMNNYLKIDPWQIIEDRFNPERNRISESLFSLGNGKMGQRANFEEQYTGDSLQGNYQRTAALLLELGHIEKRGE